VPYRSLEKRRAAVRAAKAKRKAQNPTKYRKNRAAEQRARRAGGNEARFWRLCDLLEDRPTLYDYWEQLKFYERYPEDLPVGSNPQRVKALLKQHPLSAYPETEIQEAAKLLHLIDDYVYVGYEDNYDDYVAPDFKDDPGSGRPIIDGKNVYPLFPESYQDDDY
jgi:hypothetical protein